MQSAPKREATPKRKAALRKTATPAKDATPKRKAASQQAAPKGVTAKLGPAFAQRDVDAVLRDLERHATRRFRADLSQRYGIVTRDTTLGTPMAKIKAIAKALGKDHAFAQALWRTRVYEARLLASMVAEPQRTTIAQMDRWAKDFDNWATVDTVCFNLFDRTPYAFAQVTKWARASDEFVKRAAFSLLACASRHPTFGEAECLAALPLIERAATDERNFVKKGVSWALRAIGGRRSPPVRAAARALAADLVASKHPSARWIGRDALRALAKAEG